MEQYQDRRYRTWVLESESGHLSPASVADQLPAHSQPKHPFPQTIHPLNTIFVHPPDVPPRLWGHRTEQSRQKPLPCGIIVQKHSKCHERGGYTYTRSDGKRPQGGPEKQGRCLKAVTRVQDMQMTSGRKKVLGRKNNMHRVLKQKACVACANWWKKLNMASALSVKGRKGYTC